MIEPNNPEIDVDELMMRVRSEVRRRQLGAPGANGELNGSAGFAVPLDVAPVESHVESAARFAQVRTSWPEGFAFFPLSLPPVRRFLLKVLAVVFRDQQRVNAELVAALRENIALAERTHARLVDLEDRLRRPHPDA
jgi:O-antigen chain-terminating methyltransferase